MVSRILVPLDGSPLAEQVLRHVQAIVECRDAEIHLLSVAPVVDNSSSAMLYPLHSPGRQFVDAGREQERIEAELLLYLQDVGRDLEQAGATVRRVVRFGSPADEILLYAFKHEIELIAMSTHGRSGWARWAYGSVADRVLREASCPVLLVRAKLL